MEAGRFDSTLRIALIGVCAMVFAIFGAATMGADEASAETGLASWYGPGFEGNLTANGEIYDPYGYTAAHKTLPFGTQLVVSYQGRSVNVVVNDRGPYVGDRVIDLSQGAAQSLGLDQAGVDYVDYQIVGAGYTEPAYDQGYASQETTYTDTTATTDYSQSYETTTVSDGTSQGYGGIYVVQSGDTLGGIAASLGVSVDQLAASNGIADPNFIVTGQEVYY